MNDNRQNQKHTIAGMATAFTESASTTNPETALTTLGHFICDHLGDKSAGGCPGSLKPGETDFTISGYFIVRPEYNDMILISEIGWPEEQHRLTIETGEGRPGWVVDNAAPMVLPNTDDDATFTQILSSARMGSSMYAPLMWQGSVLGLVTLASQARYSYSNDDLPLLQLVAAHAASMWVSLGGKEFLSGAATGQFLPKDRNR